MFGMERSVLVSAAWKETAPCESETQENTHLSKVGGRKRKECAVFDY